MNVTTKPASPRDQVPTASRDGWSRPYTEKIQDGHRDRLAIVFVRQSSLQQVRDHRESAALQYDLTERAERLGWSAADIQVIDEDTGQSASTGQPRSGFEQVLLEVGMGRVGIIVGFQMSRLTRTNGEWQQLLEVCRCCGTLLADESGVYEPREINDRLLLGLKGTMSEAELHLMQSRLQQGRRHKAARGDLGGPLSVGYVYTAPGVIGFDPDEQVQSVLRGIFTTFAQQGSVGAVLRYCVQHDLRLGFRPSSGPELGPLQWRPPCRSTLLALLRHPRYAGAYTYGRTTRDPSRARGRSHNAGRVRRPLEEWEVLLLDHHPAYLSWEQYLANRQRLADNQARADRPGIPRDGAALLGGLVVCGHCGYRLSVAYGGTRHLPWYRCQQAAVQHGEARCQAVPASALDGLLATAVLEALAPAGLELSLQAAADLEGERARLHEHWQQQLERARYTSQRAGRCYHAVDPENRLVARRLEGEWNAALAAEQTLEAGYARFQQIQPRVVTPPEQEQLRQLATQLPTLWQAAGAAERQTIVRLVVERIVVTRAHGSEQVAVAIHWKGKRVNQQLLTVPVRDYARLSHFPQLLERLEQLRTAGLDSTAIAAALNRDGYRTPRRQREYTGAQVRQLLARYRRQETAAERSARERLGRHEWRLRELAATLQLPVRTLHEWRRRGWVHARQASGGNRVWIVWADARERSRLRRLRACGRLGATAYPPELTTPCHRSATSPSAATAGAPGPSKESSNPGTPRAQLAKKRKEPKP